MTFHDFTVTAQGNVASHRVHDSATLVPAAVEVFARMLCEHGQSFRVPIPFDDFEHIELQWTQENDSAALATFWTRGVPLTVSALVSGRDTTADRAALQQLQTLLIRLLAPLSGGLLEPGFGMLAIIQRPAIVSVPLPFRESLSDDMQVIADMETCLAAAVFTAGK